MLKYWEPPDNFSPVKQSLYNSCVPATLAMAIDEDEQYVLDWFKSGGLEPPFHFEDEVLFLAHHGIYMGFQIKVTKPEVGSIEAFQTIDVSMPILGRAMYVIVKSKKRPGGHHAIFWDGQRVHDPDAPENFALEEYAVIDMYPLMVSEQRQADLRERYKNMKGENNG